MSEQRQGLVEDNKSNFNTYLGCANGKFVKRVADTTAKSVARKITKGVNEGKEIHEEFYKGFQGAIKLIEVERSADFGNKWVFVIDTTIEESSPEKTILKLGMKSSYADSILLRLPNINLNADVLFEAFSFIPKGETKERTGIMLKQYNANSKKWDNIPKFFTKEMPNGMPPLKEIVLDGVKKYDSTDKMLFLENLVSSKFVKEEKAVYTPIATLKQQADDEILNDDEIPF
jgi:hypothetical protein